MKKILLTSVGVVCLAGVSWGQFTMPAGGDWPTDIYFQNWSMDTTSKGVVDMASGGFTKTGAFDIPGFRRWVIYERPDSDGLGGKTSFNIMQYSNGVYEMQVHMHTPAGGAPVASVSFTGDSLSNLALSSAGSGFGSPPAAPTVDTFVNGLSASGTYLVGGAPAEEGGGGGEGVSMGGVSVEQTQDFTTGLTYDDGTFIPLHLQEQE